MEPKINYIHTTLFILISFNLCFSQKTTLENITLDTKQNGIIVQMKLKNSIDQKNIAAWQSDSEWFYITLYKVTGDSNQLSMTPLPKEIRKFQTIFSSESTQLGFRLRHSIEHYDITQNESANIIMISLHYPYDLFTTLPVITEYDALENKLGMPRGLRSWMYFTGFSLTVNGLLTQGKGKTNWETITGLSTLLATIIADKLWSN